MIDNFTHFPLFAPGFDPTWGSDPTRPHSTLPLTPCASHPRLSPPTSVQLALSAAMAVAATTTTAATSGSRRRTRS
ncbi:Uncharacterised protein [Mobiluncus mulieris]|uniref:Uncharacterized protein n=1 Tax=Mobiluncus mulieris TaxID=2052 RepID=A0A8G2HU58_9ACTO|nr:Uncharacterised protein [Mobiluncus mulieris]